MMAWPSTLNDPAVPPSPVAAFTSPWLSQMPEPPSIAAARDGLTSWSRRLRNSSLRLAASGSTTATITTPSTKARNMAGDRNRQADRPAARITGISLRRFSCANVRMAPISIANGNVSITRAGVRSRVSWIAVSRPMAVRLPMVRICSTTSISRIAMMMTPNVSSSDMAASRRT